MAVTSRRHHEAMSVTADPAAAVHKVKEELAEKVRKLLNQAEDPAATPDEAQAFTMKAQQMMTKYSIDLAMVAGQAETDRIVEDGWTVQNPYAVHKVSMINSVARVNDCRAIYADLAGGRKRIDIVGFPADVEWVRTLSMSLEVQLAGALAAAVTQKPPGVHGRTYSVAFVVGFANEVSRRLQQARRDAVASSEADQSRLRDGHTNRLALEAGLEAEPAPPSVALVLVAKAARVDDDFKVRHPSTRSVSRQLRLRSWAGYSPGRAAGRRASLARGSIGGSRRSLSA